MPPFGRAHKLLSPTHPDTSPPAGGADPDDGQVVTWSDALDAFHAADPAGGVTDHGALTGLFPDDDHAQYALADKSRPSPWVAAADLAPRSLADLGTKAHDLLAGLTDDDHSIYALLAGRSGGQTFVGDTAASGHLTLQATAHATRGYVRAQDDLQLLSDVMRDSGGNARVTLAATSPHVALTGDLDVSGHAAVGAAASPSTQDILAIKDTITENALGYGINVDVKGSRATGAQVTYGVTGKATSQGTPTLIGLAGLYFSAIHESSGPVSIFAGCAAVMGSLAAGTGAIGTAQAFFAAAASWSTPKPTVTCGLDVEEQGAAGVGTAIGVRVAQQTGTLAYLAELTGAFAFPYLRVLAGAAPAANQTMLYLAEGGYNLRRVQWMDPGAGGANFVGGERVMELV